MNGGSDDGETFVCGKGEEEGLEIEEDLASEVRAGRVLYLRQDSLVESFSR